MCPDPRLEDHLVGLYPTDSLILPSPFPWPNQCHYPFTSSPHPQVSTSQSRSPCDQSFLAGSHSPSHSYSGSSCPRSPQPGSSRSGVLTPAAWAAQIHRDRPGKGAATIQRVSSATGPRPGPARPLRGSQSAESRRARSSPPWAQPRPLLTQRGRRRRTANSSPCAPLQPAAP